MENRKHITIEWMIKIMFKDLSESSKTLQTTI